MTVSPRWRPTDVVQRDADGPVVGRFEVVDVRADGAYRSLTFVAPQLARTAAPGQFVELAVAAPGTLLRRPFSIASVDAEGPRAGSVTVVFDVHGPGTEWLAGVAEHDRLDVAGPLGVPFAAPPEPTTVVLVAGGYGAAPLVWLGRRLRRAGHRVHVVIGAATEGRLLGELDAKRVAGTVTVTTEDGSRGTTGRVTDVLPERITTTGATVVYGVGPMGMLRAVAGVAADAGVSAQVAVEEHMACGVGVCWTCVVPVHDGEGGSRNVRACLDGPVFDAAELDWEASRW